MTTLTKGSKRENFKDRPMDKPHTIERDGNHVKVITDDPDVIAYFRGKGFT